MKHCPNPDCPGLETSRLVSEYQDGVEFCAECGAYLAPGAAPEADSLGRPAPEPDLKLVSVFRSGKETSLVIAQSLLEDAGIPFLAQGETIQNLFGFGRLVAVNPITGPVDLLVREDDAAAAAEVLRDVEA